MDVLKKLFNKSLNQASPVQTDMRRVVEHDVEGNEKVSYVTEDYPSLQRSLGFVSDWSLESLLKAGINPAFGIHTGLPTRIEGQNAVNEYLNEAERLLAEIETPENES